ncbi:MAG: protein-L-isoaspartate(D-aspartate) O-methyltransferase [Bacteroidales bacterium]
MEKMDDTYRHKGLRKKLVQTLRRKGINNEEVLKAFEKVPRHFFMESGFIEFAYKDQAFPIGNGQTISQPYTVAVQTELLNPQKHDKILEIGTGSGYQAAILCEIGANVFSIERHRDLYLKAKSVLNEMGYQPYLFYGDGFEGVPRYAPYDKILITAAAGEIPDKLFEQLKVEGKMVLPLGGNMGQEMTVITKTDENSYEEDHYGSFIFVPMVKGKNGNNNKKE